MNLAKTFPRQSQVECGGKCRVGRSKIGIQVGIKTEFPIFIGLGIVHPLTKPLPKFDAEVFQEIGAYIASDSLLSQTDKNFRSPLECLASLMHREPRFHVVVPPEKWATKSLFLNFAKHCRDGSYSFRYESDATFCPCHQDDAALHSRRQDCDNEGCLIIYILSQWFSRGINEVYEAFREDCSWADIVDYVDKHPKAIDGVTSYLTGLSEAMKRRIMQILTSLAIISKTSIKQRLFTPFVLSLLEVAHRRVLS